MALYAKADDNLDVPLDTEDSSLDGPLAKEEEKVAEFKPLYAYLVLGLVLICRITVMWHRAGLSYAYGYSGVGAAAGSPMYEISKFYP